MPRSARIGEVRLEVLDDKRRGPQFSPHELLVIDTVLQSLGSFEAAKAWLPDFAGTA